MAKVAYTIAAFNRSYVRGYHEPDNDTYSPDYYTDGRYEFVVVDRDPEGLRINENFITISHEYEVEWSKGMDILEGEEYDLNDVLKDEQLYEELSKHLKAPLLRYRFKADDILNGKVYTLQPQKSNVPKYIEEFLFRFAEVLKEGIHTVCVVDKVSTPVTIDFDYRNSVFKMTWKNFLGVDESLIISLEEVFEIINVKSIASRPLKNTPDIKNDALLYQFIYRLIPDKLAKLTNCLGPEATMDDFCEVLKFSSTFNLIMDKNFVYDPDNSFDPQTRQRINEINEKLGDRGKLFEDRTISQSMNK